MARLGTKAGKVQSRARAADSGPSRPLRFRQVPRSTQTALPSRVVLFLLVELDCLAQADEQGFRAGEPIWVRTWSRIVGVDFGRIQPFEDRA